MWLAAAAGLLTAGTLREWGVGLGRGGREIAHLPWLAFAATLLVYNLDAALPYKHGQPAGASARRQWQQQHRRLLLALAAGAAAMAGWFFLVDGWWRHPVLLGHLAALALLYSVPVPGWAWRGLKREGGGRGRALREIPLLKGWLIAYVWAAVTVGLPALALERTLAQTWPLLAQRLLLVLALALVFDIRDVSRDRAAGLRTFPVVVGVAATRWLGVAALALSVGVGIYRGESLAALLLPAGCAAAAIVGATEARGDYYFALFTDGVLLVRAVMYFVF
ncbi:UbiA family prenyltransferase [uncultured Hymenobacter sp.]|uniref:UbiA family prenyltransferase n=1 Tax=uncultured Hymenobacter sp. TaxID=170016 RepID=UPI0035CA687A